MKKVILMAAVAMLFAATAAAQGKVTTTAKGNAPATSATTCKKDAKCPNAHQCQGKKVDATTTTNQGNVVNAKANGKESYKKGNNAVGPKANADANVMKNKPNTNAQATTKVTK